MLGLVAAAVVLIGAVVGGALALGGGGGGDDDGDGGDQAAAAEADGGEDDGCPDEGPFICLVSASFQSGTLVAEFQTVDAELGETAVADFFLDSQPSSTVRWEVEDPFETSLNGNVSSGTQLCARLVDGSGAIDDSGNCTDIES